MQLKNLDTGVALPLPDDLLWSDEHAWSPAVANASYLITGALLIQSATRQAGRPITLSPKGQARLVKTILFSSMLTTEKSP